MTDLIERQSVLDTIHRFFTEEVDKIPTKKTEDGEVYVIHKCQPLFEMNKALCKRIKALPSVTPAERTGHWINDRNKNNVRCSVCGRGYKDVCATASITSYSYCPNCGARMVEPQEGEE